MAASWWLGFTEAAGRRGWRLAVVRRRLRQHCCDADERRRAEAGDEQVLRCCSGRCALMVLVQTSRGAQRSRSSTVIRTLRSPPSSPASICCPLKAIHRRVPVTMASTVLHTMACVRSPQDVHSRIFRVQKVHPAGSRARRVRVFAKPPTTVSQLSPKEQVRDNAPLGCTSQCQLPVSARARRGNRAQPA